MLEASGEYGVKAYGIDISDVAIEKTKKLFPDFKVLAANAEDIPFSNGYFDLITCIGSLERMLDLNKVLSEMKRVGTADCRYCFLVRNANTNSWKIFKKGLGLKVKESHQDAKPYKTWVSIFKEAGFIIDMVYPDQYPLVKKAKRKTLWLGKIDYKKLIEPTASIEKANEFMFILKNKNDTRFSWSIVRFLIPMGK